LENVLFQLGSGVLGRFLEIIGIGLFGQQAHFDTWCVDNGYHSVQDCKFSSVSGHAVLFVDNGESFTNETVEEAAFATIGQADQ
jgi:hypothetical protein